MAGTRVKHGRYQGEVSIKTGQREGTGSPEIPGGIFERQQSGGVPGWLEFLSKG